MKTKSFFIGVLGTLVFCGTMCSCNNGKEAEKKTESVAEVAEADSVVVEAVPYEGCDIDSKWANSDAELTIFKKDGKLFISILNKETKKYDTTEVEECQSEGMAGYRSIEDKSIEYLSEDGSIINYVKGDQKAVYEWIE